MRTNGEGLGIWIGWGRGGGGSEIFDIQSVIEQS